MPDEFRRREDFTLLQERLRFWFGSDAAPRRCRSFDARERAGMHRALDRIIDELSRRQRARDVDIEGMQETWKEERERQ